MSLFDLTGKVAVVTGSTKGIGLGIVQQMAAHGARVVLSSRDQAACDQAAAELNAQYGKGQVIAKGVACDLDKLEDIDNLAVQARAAFGGVDILVCNASVLSFIGPSATTPADTFERLLSTNIHHNFRLVTALRPDIAKRGGGAIVLIGSVAAVTAAPNNLAYGVSKAGMAHMARCLADEYAADNIRVNIVAPGLIRSFTSNAKLGDAGFKAAGVNIPLRRVGEPEDIAGAVIFLTSQAGSYVTGVSLSVDGGRAFLNAPGKVDHLAGAKVDAGSR